MGLEKVCSEMENIRVILRSGEYFYFRLLSISYFSYKKEFVTTVGGGGFLHERKVAKIEGSW